ncbi:DUF397 domain-containing protein [Streptomyces sp. MS19]|uniref:DUF397 domain-containing protein n=1 Tax=Streptomyces sp. MS19 TaxID=3385972 RepID=UPI0039A2FA01
MKKIDPHNVQWSKSSYSNGNGDCVEVADLGSSIGVRDSKRPGSAMLTPPLNGWSAFVTSVVDGTLIK